MLVFGASSPQRHRSSSQSPSAPPLHSLAAHVPNSVALFFGAAAFFYWTIAHVALSVPLPARRRSA